MQILHVIFLAVQLDHVYHRKRLVNFFEQEFSLWSRLYGAVNGD